MPQYIGDENGNELSGSTGDDVIRGNGGNDSLWGGTEGADRLYGGDGDDIVSDGKGDAVDTLSGGGGHDTLSMFYGTFFGGGIGPFNFTFVAGADMITPGGSIATSFERVNITGSDGGDTITGGRFNDQVRGWQGNDSLDGGRGSDFMIGDNGNDTLYGGDGNDTVTGNGGSDVLYGGAGNDFVRGGANFDVQQGDDTISGGAGADDLWTGPNMTVLLYDTSSEGVHVDLRRGLGFGGDAQGDTIRPGGGIRLVGSDFDDYLIGGLTMEGGAGEDRLEHSNETRSISGGDGVDTFVFLFDKKTIWETPLIADFDVEGGEVIDVSQIDARPVGGDQAFKFIGTAAFSGRAGEARYEYLDGDTMIQLNNTKGGGQVFTILLDGEHVLTAGDFVL